MAAFRPSPIDRPSLPSGTAGTFGLSVTDLKQRAAQLRDRSLSLASRPPQRPRRRTNTSPSQTWRQSQRDDLIAALQQWADSLDRRKIELDAREQQLHLRERQLRASKGEPIDASQLAQQFDRISKSLQRQSAGLAFPIPESRD